MRVRPGYVFAASLLATAVLSAHFPLMAFYRKAFARKFPDLAAGWTYNGAFSVLGGRYPPFIPEETIYAGRANSVVLHGLPYDPFIKENRRSPTIANDLIQYLFLGWTAKALGGVQPAWFSVRLLCGAAWFLLFYWLARRLTGEDGFSFFLAALVVFYSYLFTGMFIDAVPWGELLTFKGLFRTVWVLASYGRTESLLRLPRPGITYAVLYAATLWAFRAYGSRRRGELLLAGLFGGLLAYVHFDIWTTVMVSYGIMALWESWRLRRVLHASWLPAALASIVSLPWLFLNYPPDMEKVARLAVFSRAPDLWGWAYFGAFALGVKTWQDSAEGAGRFLTAFMGGLFVMCNVQVLTGYSIFRSHWYWFGNIYLLLFAASFFRGNLKRKSRLWFSLAGMLFGATLLQNVVYAGLHYPHHANSEAYDAAYRWLSRPEAKDAVVVTLDPEVACEMGAFTGAKVLVAYGDPVFSDISTRENLRRLKLAVGAYGLKFAQYLAATARLEGEFGEAGYFLPPFIGREKRKQLLQSAQKEEPGRGFAADYVWVGPFERGLFLDGVPLESATPEFRSGEVAIYRAPGR